MRVENAFHVVKPLSEQILANGSGRAQSFQVRGNKNIPPAGVGRLLISGGH